MNWGWFSTAMAIMFFYSMLLNYSGLSHTHLLFWALLFIPAIMFVLGMNHGKALLNSKNKEKK